MKTLRILMVMIIGLSLLLAAGTAFAGGKRPHSGYSYGAYSHVENVHVDRHLYRYPVAPRYARGCYPAYPCRVCAPPVYRGYRAPYAPAYTYGHVYRPGWSIGFSFGW